MPEREPVRPPSAAAGVAVVIPVLNGGLLVLEAVESVRAQGDIVVEIVVVDNGSVDGTPELLAQHGVRVVSERRPGAGAARKAGVAATAAPLLMFVDHDDVLLPGAVGELSAALLDQDGDLAYGCRRNVVLVGDVAAYRHLSQPLSAPLPSSTLIRRDMLDRHGAMPDDSYGWITWISAARDGGARVVRIPQTVCERRIHGDNVTLAGDSYAPYFALIRARLDGDRV